MISDCAQFDWQLLGRRLLRIVYPDGRFATLAPEYQLGQHLRVLCIQRRFHDGSSLWFENLDRPVNKLDIIDPNIIQAIEVGLASGLVTSKGLLKNFGKRLKFYRQWLPQRIDQIDSILKLDKLLKHNVNSLLAGGQAHVLRESLQQIVGSDYACWLQFGLRIAIRQIVTVCSPSDYDAVRHNVLSEAEYLASLDVRTGEYGQQRRLTHLRALNFPLTYNTVYAKEELSFLPTRTGLASLEIAAPISTTRSLQSNRTGQPTRGRKRDESLAKRDDLILNLVSQVDTEIADGSFKGHRAREVADRFNRSYVPSTWKVRVSASIVSNVLAKARQSRPSRI